jgi:hypothetical protein
VGVIGAGPAGMTAAYRLQQLGAEVTVFEAGRHIGGMARSFDLWGHRVDLGPHRFFSTDQRVNQIWREVLGADSRMVRRRTRIHYRGRFFDYPLKVGNVLSNLGVADTASSLASYARERLRPEYPPAAAIHSKLGWSAVLVAAFSRYFSNPTARNYGASHVPTSMPISPRSESDVSPLGSPCWPHLASANSGTRRLWTSLHIQKRAAAISMNGWRNL